MDTTGFAPSAAWGETPSGASCWPGEEADALIVTRLMQTAEPETALEQSWLLSALIRRTALGHQPNQSRPSVIFSRIRPAIGSPRHVHKRGKSTRRLFPLYLTVWPRMRKASPR